MTMLSIEGIASPLIHLNIACGVLKPNTVCTSATLSPLPFIKALMFAPVAIISIVGAAMGIKITTFLNRIIKTACVS